MSFAILSEDVITSSQNLMHQFLVSAEALYGIDLVTFNMHLHLHVHDILRDYGPC